MSYVIGFNYNYMIDLSDKYIVPENKFLKFNCKCPKCEFCHIISEWYQSIEAF